MNWFYKDQEITDINQLPENTFGFIYEITHIPSGKKYIGKKQVMSYRTLPPLKGEKKKRKVVKEGDWKTYYGSHAEVKKLVKESKEDFKREILQFVPTKKQLTYFELAFLFKRDVLLDDTYLNDNINGTFYRRDFDRNI